MKLYLANPIYDTVFKYLMEDERIARTLILALLKKKVVHLEQRAHEYAGDAEMEINEKDKLLTNAIEGMLGKGMDMATVASILGLTEVEVKHFIATNVV